ncbi:hypothetical protein C1645_824741 [Glomus cerebriforme]|uniref:Uncharacterized protein n=1 Tax=Glomus cerebriforme TaxID=658196 RepID=A0A397STQ8_9GLOM|nr:hypothetical protein C1645_824741 [Glomus cerebriforme]
MDWRLGTFHGHIFKQYAHMILSNGRTFNIHELVDKSQKISHNSSTFILTKCEGQVFHNYNEIGNSNMYYCPYFMNNENIDSVIFPDMIFQMTVSEKHPIKYNGLLEAKSKLGGNMKLYFVVSEDKYDLFIYKQQITISDG